MDENTKLNLEFKNFWRQDDPAWKDAVSSMWRKYVKGLTDEEINKRLSQIVFIVHDHNGEVAGVSTAYKAYIKQLKNYLYAFRCFIIPEKRMPGLDAALLIKTRDYLEEIHQSDGPETERSLGIITLVDNEMIMKHRREAVWTASKMVYIGNSGNGKHIRVYYFKGAVIKV